MGICDGRYCVVAISLQLLTFDPVIVQVGRGYREFSGLFIRRIRLYPEPLRSSFGCVHPQSCLLEFIQPDS